MIFSGALCTLKHIRDNLNRNDKTEPYLIYYSLNISYVFTYVTKSTRHLVPPPIQVYFAHRTLHLESLLHGLSLIIFLNVLTIQ